jgi:hypothetical protein
MISKTSRASVTYLSRLEKQQRKAADEASGKIYRLRELTQLE